MSSRMPPIPPASRSPKGTQPKHSNQDKDKTSEKAGDEHRKHANAGEEGQTANIKQNTTNQGYFHGRRVK